VTDYRCRMCDVVKPATEFHARSTAKCGHSPYCKSCVAARRKAHHEQNGDRAREQMRAYYAAHGEEIRERVAAWKQDARADPEYRQAETEFNREWRRRNPGKMAAANARQRARGRFDPDWTDAEWQQLLDQYGHRCLCCGADGPLSPDHVIPLSQGGPNDIGNIQPLCRPCNTRKGVRTVDYRAAAPHGDPAHAAG
jgi:5-methylcytosine-specific restriction endonuclease McrA